MKDGFAKRQWPYRRITIRMRKGVGAVIDLNRDGVKDTPSLRKKIERAVLHEYAMAASMKNFVLYL